jgi:hypothetical protein
VEVRCAQQSSSAQRADTYRCGCRRHPHPNATLFEVLLCLPTAPGLPLLGHGDFGTSPLFWTALGQATACLYVLRWCAKPKAQWWGKKLSARDVLAVGTQLARCAASRSKRHISKQAPSLIGRAIGLAVAATRQELQRFRRQVLIARGCCQPAARC